MSLARAIASSSDSNAADRRHRAEDLLVEARGRRRARRRARWAGRSSRGRPGSRRPTTHVAPLSSASSHQLGHLLARGLVDQRPDLHVLLGPAADLQRAHLLAEPASRTPPAPARPRGSGWPRCRPRRCCASWRAARPRPRRRGRRRRRPGTGALPPSSIDIFSTFFADASISLRPTSVEPVKRQLAQPRVLDQRAGACARRRGREDVEHAAGQPGLLEDLAQREHRQRRLLGRLHHDRAAGRDRRADLARAHRHREVPGRDHQARPDRLLHHEHPAGAVARTACSCRRCAAPRPSTSGRSRPRRRSRPSTRPPACPSRASSACASSSARSISSSKAFQRIPARSLGGDGAPTPPAASTAASSAALRVLGRGVGHLADRLLGGRVDHRERRRRRERVAPLAPDVELLLDLVDDLLFLRWRCSCRDRLRSQLLDDGHVDRVVDRQHDQRRHVERRARGAGARRTRPPTRSARPACRSPRPA